MLSPVLKPASELSAMLLPTPCPKSETVSPNQSYVVSYVLIAMGPYPFPACSDRHEQHLSSLFALPHLPRG